MLTKEQAVSIYDILVGQCGASIDKLYREAFIYQQENHDISEWRFQGALGFGGKFWNCGGQWYINCYREDERPFRLKIIEKVNKELEKLRKTFECPICMELEQYCRCNNERIS